MKINAMFVFIVIFISSGCNVRDAYLTNYKDQKGRIVRKDLRIMEDDEAWLFKHLSEGIFELTLSLPLKSDNGKYRIKDQKVSVWDISRLSYHELYYNTKEEKYNDSLSGSVQFHKSKKKKNKVLL